MAKSRKSFWNVRQLGCHFFNDMNTKKEIMNVHDVIENENVRIAFVICGLIIAFAYLSKLSFASQPKYSKSFLRQMDRLVKQAKRWHTSARQDSNRLMSLMHANSALSYANACRTLASDETLENISGVRINELMYYLEEDQQSAMRDLFQKYPQLKPNTVYGI